jgi:uncharacterized protein YxeA
MKKMMVILVMLAVVCGGALFAVSNTATLTLNYLKDASAQYGIGWFAEESTTAAGKSSASFNTTEGETVNVTAYLKVTSNFSPNLVTLSALLPNLKNEDYSAADNPDTTTISYTAALSSTTSSTTSLSTTSLSSSLNPTAGTTFATIPANVSVAQTSWVKFVFTPSASDLSSATANKSYTGDVVVTMTSGS